MGVIPCHGECVRMEEGNVNNTLNYLFPNIKGGRKIVCEASSSVTFTNGINTEVHFLFSQTCKRELFAKLVNGSQ